MDDNRRGRSSLKIITMYKINLQQKTSEKIKEGFFKDTELTYLQVAIKNTPAKLIGVSVFFQEDIPECLPKYWKNSDGVVVEMTAEEKKVVDDNDLKREGYLGYNSRVKVNFDYCFDNYKALLDRAVSLATSEPSECKVVSEGQDENKISLSYWNRISDTFRLIIEADENFELKDWPEPLNL